MAAVAVALVWNCGLCGMRRKVTVAFLFFNTLEPLFSSADPFLLSSVLVLCCFGTVRKCNSQLLAIDDRAARSAASPSSLLPPLNITSTAQSKPASPLSGRGNTGLAFSMKAPCSSGHTCHSEAHAATRVTVKRMRLQHVT